MREKNYGIEGQRESYEGVDYIFSLLSFLASSS